MRRLFVAWIPFLLAWLVGSGCSSRFTELVIVVTADPSMLVPSDVDQIQVVLTPSANMMENSFSTEVGALTDFPVTFGIRPTRSGATAPVTITVRGVRDGEVRVTRMIRAQFVEGERRFLVVNLQQSCVNVSCEETCDPAVEGCVPACVDGRCTVIPDLTTTPVPLEWNDAGNLEFDAGIRPDRWAPDTGIDVGPDSFVPPDAWPYSCEGVNTNVGVGAGNSQVEVIGVPSRPICVVPGAYPDGGLIVEPMDVDPPMELAFALHQPVLDHRNTDYDVLSFDLDGYASDGLDPRAGECLNNGSAVSADGAGGIDNFFGRTLMGQLVTAAPILGIPDPERALADRVNAGMLAPVLMLRGWNGQPFDTQVTAGMSFAVDVAPASYTGSPPTRLGGIGPRPVWDGSDRAYLQCSSLEGCGTNMPDRNRPLVLDETAYVANNYLVLSLNDAYPLTLPIGDSNGQANFYMTGGRIIAHLTPEGTIDQPVRIVGRMQKNLFFSYLESVGLCPGLAYYEVIYNNIAMAIDGALDLLPRPNVPGNVQPQESACRAFSLMFLFAEATRVEVASDIVAIPGTRVGCTDAGVPPSDSGVHVDANWDAGL